MNAQTPLSIVNGGFEGTFTPLNPTSPFYAVFPYQNSSITQGWSFIGNGNNDATTKSEGNQSLKLLSADDANLAKDFNEPGTPGTVAPGFAIQAIKSTNAGPFLNPDKIRLSFKAKYTKVGSDVGQVAFIVQDTLLTGSSDNKTLYTGGIDFDANVASWEPFTLSLTKEADGSANRILIVAVSSKNGYYNNNAVTAGATLWLDDFKLFNVASIDENVISDLKVYPNPASDVLNFETDEEIESVVVTSIEGKVVRSVKEPKVNVSDLKSGVYVYRVTTRSGKQ